MVERYGERVSFLGLELSKAFDSVHRGTLMDICAGTKAGNRRRAANDTVSLIEDNPAWQDKWRTGTSV